MIKDLTKYIPLTTIIISYFFLCGGLYLYGFWSTFNIDISNLINITDIPKSFIFPFVAYNGFYFLYIIIDLFTTKSPKDGDNDEYAIGREPIKLDQERTVIKFLKLFIIRIFKKLFLSIEGWILLAFWTIVLLYEDHKMEPSFWLYSCSSLALFISFRLQEVHALKKLLPYFYIRNYIINALLFIPMFSFGLGRITSLSIYHNSDKHYIKIIGSSNPDKDFSTDTLKFIGFVGDKLIVSSLDNKRIIYINQSSYDQLIVENQTETTTAK